jgi:PAS domain S-box-containing protein
MNKAHILIVEDEAVVAESIAWTLKMSGYSCSMASSAEEAISKAYNDNPDLILMDILLSGEKDGITITEEIHSHVSIPIIYLTALSNEETLERAKLTGPYGYIIKPFNSRELIHTIEIAIYKRTIEMKMQESEERYRIAIENSNDGVIMARGDFIIYVNRKFVEIFGYKNEEDVLEKPVSLIIHPDDRQRVCDFNRRRQAGEDVPPRYEFKGLRRDGSTLFIEISAAKTTYLGESVSLAYLRDVTDRKKLEEQFLQSQKMEVVGHLAGSVAHDFNNILTAIVGYTHLISLKIAEDDPIRDYVNQIFSSTERATALTRSLLAFSRKQIVIHKHLNLNDVVKNIRKFLMRLISEDIEMETISSHERLTIMADKGQIEQVIMNLVTNARDAMPKGGRIIIQTSVFRMNDSFVSLNGYGEAGRYALLTISDTGKGMDSETQRKIFEPFFTTKEVGKGTGLGLSTVYGIIKQHNGYITCYSEPGKGTTFKLYIPLAGIDIQEEETYDTTQTLRRGNETILLAEDQEDVRNVISQILKGYGYSVISASNGSEAIDLFVRNSDAVKLVILDVVMPVKNGKETYEEIRKIKPGISTLFMSGYTADIIKARGDIGDEFQIITKPVLAWELLKKVGEMLDAQ